MKKNAVKTISIVMIIIAVLGTMYVMVSASVDSPEISNSRPITAYTLSDSTTAYSTSSLSSESGTILAGDEICIYKIGKNSNREYFAYCSYTNENCSRYAYIPLSAVTEAKVPAMAYTAREDVVTFRRADDTCSDGSISEGDIVYKLATKGERTQVIFGSESDESEWTMTWISTDDYNNSIKPAVKATITTAFTNVSDFVQNA